MCYSASNPKCKELNDLDFMFGWICAKIINFEHLKIKINWLNIDIHIAVNQNRVLLVLTTSATCFSHVDHIQMLKYMTFKPYILLVCGSLFFVHLNLKVVKILILV